LSEVINTFDLSKSDIVFGDLYYVKQNNTDLIVRKWVTKPFIPGSFRKGWHPPHPTFFVKNKIYNKFGIFDLNFKLAADFELMLRFLEKNKISNTYIYKPLIKMRMGGASNKNLLSIIDQNKMCYLAFKKNNLKITIFYPIYRLLPKVLQYLKKNKSL